MPNTVGIGHITLTVTDLKKSQDFYNKVVRYDAAKTIEAFGSRLRDKIDIASLVRDVESTVRLTMQQPIHVSLWVRNSSGAP